MYEGREEPLSYFEVLKRASSFLTKNNYSTFAAEWLMRERLSWTKTDLIKNYQKKMSEDERNQFQMDLKEYLQGKPMQQIIGHDWFYGRKFILTKDTLIPRPETEEWLDQLLKRLPNRPLKVLDIGTGSGVLAITQKLERPEDNLTAIDISEKALQIAKKNADRLEADIQFIKSNLFQEITGQSYDLIVSNPPYIAYNEKNLMDESVLNYEPKEALFAENEGLAIYEEIAANVSKYLNSPYYLALEIGYAQGEAVSKIFKEALTEANVEIWTDLNALDRLVFIYS